ncbi:unnamed protein product [Caenorhabditis angaria]|uniref:Pre-mRNA polyadenylation factor Fip1 domain-containing protein n=1 Tax=Caenorhabditis angaria TaxID=860376 RepID=A0A9P1IUC2_9PELO|nr:unnamed protein product [Caenorhabditis angaria]
MEDVESFPPGLEPLNADIPEGMEDKEEEETEATNENNETQEEEEEEDNPFADDDDSDEEGGGVQVTIRKVEPVVRIAQQQGKLDIDAAPMLNDKTIYDIDLAQMEDKPWRKPGADITDYFNYGFTEDTFNIYCERQKKLRSEFGNNQQKANQALFNNIHLVNPLANPVIAPMSASVVKVLTDNGGRFKPTTFPQPNQNMLNNDPPVMRTVIGGPPTQSAPVIDFSRPPPGMSMPPPNMDAPPGIDSDRPPGVLTPPSATNLSAIPASLDLNLGMPPPGMVGSFNPAMPPPMGLMGAPFAMAPFSRAGFGPGPGPSPIATNRPSYNEDDDRRRKRSRSPSKKESSSSSRRRDRERESSRRHRSRSRSTERKTSSRHRDDRDRKRDRRDDDERSSKKSRSSRRDDDDERRERKSEKSSRSRHNDEDNVETREQEEIEEEPQQE